AQIETSKAFAKEFFARHAIPTARGVVCSSADEARTAIERFGYPAVLKADGLAGGKGVLTLESAADADKALALFFDERVFGDAGDRVIVEEFLRGHEASYLAICDGEVAVPLPTARDYKKVYDGDGGDPAPDPDRHVLGPEGVALTRRARTLQSPRGQGRGVRGSRSLLGRLPRRERRRESDHGPDGRRARAGRRDLPRAHGAGGR